MIVVLADDLSGAAEIGGVAWRYGLDTEIQHTFDATTDADLIVVNTDSRALPTDVSVPHIMGIARQCRAAKIERVFVKVDSVLRGHVLADLNPAMTGLGRQRVLLAPANPGLGRTIERGIYRVNGVSLHETEFARDPDFPATTASVVSLLRQRRDNPTAITSPVSIHAPDDILPGRGVIICATTHSADLTRWAETIDANTLPAGAAEFFAAYLRIQGYCARNDIPPSIPHPSPQLFICGSASMATQEFCRQSATDGAPLLTMPQALFDGAGHDEGKLLDAWATSATAALAHSPRVIIAINRPETMTPNKSEQLLHLLSAAAARILGEFDVGEIFAEGGATASAVINAQGWSRLRVEEELAPGVVRARPAKAPELRFTVKPGSYIWPATARHTGKPAVRHS